MDFCSIQILKKVNTMHKEVNTKSNDGIKVKTIEVMSKIKIDKEINVGFLEQ